MAEQIKLVGIFDDRITPKLKALNKQLNNLNKKFRSFDRTLDGLNKKMKTLANTSFHVSKNLERTAGAIRGSRGSLKSYAKEVKKLADAQKKLADAERKANRAKPRGGGRGGGGGYQMPTSLREATGFFRKGGGGMGGLMGTITKANLAAAAIGKGLDLLVQGLSSIAAGIGRAVAAGKAAEAQAIQMATTMVTLGGVKKFGDAMALADDNLKHVSQIAAKLPGATADYANLLAQTMDDQIEAFGSLDAVQADLAKGQKSVTALLGVAGKLANLNPDMVGFDLMQLRVNPRNFRQSQILTRNPALMKFYQQGLEQFGGDYFKSLEFALNRAIPESAIDALTQTFDAQMEGLKTAFFDPSSGLLGFARNVTVMGESTNVMRELGKLMVEINRILEAFLSTIPIDPMEVLAQLISNLTYVLKAFADIYTKIVNALQPGYEAMKTAFSIILDGLNTLARVIFDVVMIPFRALGTLLGGVNEEFSMLKMVMGVVIAPFVFLANVLSGAIISVARFQEALASLPWIGGMFGGQAAAKQARERRENEQARLRHLNSKFGELFGIIDEDAKKRNQAEANIKASGFGAALAAIKAFDPKAEEKRLEEERKANESAEEKKRKAQIRAGIIDSYLGGSTPIPSFSGSTGGASPRGRGAAANQQSKAYVQQRKQQQQQSSNVQSLVTQQVRTNDFLNKDLKQIRKYTYDIRGFQDLIFGLLAVMLGMSKKQAKDTIKSYNKGHRGGAAFIGGGSGFGAGPGMASGVQGGGGGSVGGFGVDPTKASNVIQAAEKNLGIMNGVAVQCANAMVAVHKSAGITTQVTKKAWDGMQSGEQLASRFFGDDVGQKVLGKENLKVGDMLAFGGTYGGYSKDTITHVGMYAGKNEAGEHMMYDHTRKGGLVKRKMSTFGDKFLYGSRLHGMKGAAAMGGPAAAGMSGASGAGFNSQTWDIFRKSVADIESGGHANPYGITGGSGNHYEGKYQMGAAAKQDAARRLGIATPSRAQFLANPALQERMFKAFTEQNHQYLMKDANYAKLSPQRRMEILGYAHNQGAGGASKFLRTGVVGRDGFGTKATKYSEAIRRNMGSMGGVGAPSSQMPAQRMSNVGPQASAAGSGGGTNIGTVNVTANGVNDPQQIANQVAQEIMSRTYSQSHSNMLV